jgi:hypothetical protein
VSSKADPLADLAAVTDMVATRLASLLLRIDQLPAGVADEVKQAAAELDLYVAVLEQIGVDPDRPIPRPADLPKTKLPAATLAASTMRGGQPFPTPQAEEKRDERTAQR